jgi:hypothetical protein
MDAQKIDGLTITSFEEMPQKIERQQIQNFYCIAKILIFHFAPYAD